MSRHFLSILSVGSLLTLSLASLQAADSPDAKLREQLRNTMLQLRTAQDDLATLQGKQTENEQQVKTLTGQLEVVTKQESEEKAASDSTIATLKTQVSDKDAKLTELQSALERMTAAYKQAADVARAKEGDRAKLASEVIVLNRTVADREAKNLELFKVGNEILTRYEKFSLGQSLAAREPFVSLTRVKLENQVQDYQDKLLDQKIHPGSETPSPATPPPATVAKRHQ